MKKNKLKLYLVSQTENSDYDTYDSFVVACKSEEEARHTNPSNGIVMTEEDWSYPYSSWCSSSDSVKVTYLGIADPSVHHGIVCSSFNAG
jgi:hypothetical protein